MLKKFAIGVIALGMVSGCTVSVGQYQKTKFTSELPISSVLVTMPESNPTYISDHRLEKPKDVTLINNRGEKYVVKDSVFYGEHEHVTNTGTYVFRYAISDEVFAGEMSSKNGKCREFFVDKNLASSMKGCGITAINLRLESYRTEKKMSISFN